MSNLSGDTIICADCGFVGPARKTKRGSSFMERFIWIAFFFPGILYTIWRRSDKPGCPKCGSKNLLKFETPEGEAVWRRYLGTSGTTPAPAQPAPEQQAHPAQAEPRRLSKDESRRRWDELRDLWNAYDPLDVVKLNVRDEYETFCGPMMRLLEQGADEAGLVRYISNCDEYITGILEADPAKREAAGAFAARVKAWFNAGWNNTYA